MATSTYFFDSPRESPNIGLSAPLLHRRIARKRRHCSNMTASQITNISNVHQLDGFIYDRSSEWGVLFPSAKGNQQSPINIDSRRAVFDSGLNDPPLAFNYVTSRETEIFNNGDTLIVYPKSKSDTSLRSEPISKSVISGGPLPKGFQYELSEIRFHWGSDNSRGTEHIVNGKAYAMEIQLLHYSARLYSSLEAAFGKKDGIAIISVFTQLNSFREHQGMQALFPDTLSDLQHKGCQRTVTSSFNPSCLLPDLQLGDYWTYTGSLTFPPCSENVTWILLRYPLVLSSNQVDEFRQLRTHSRGHTDHSENRQLVDNVRPVQPLNNRTVWASFQCGALA